MSGSDTGSNPSAFSWGRLMAAALLPTFLFSFGTGAIIPVIPTIAGDLGASLAIAGLVAAMLVVGQLIGDLPAGALVARLGERQGMFAASGVAALASVGMALAPNVPILALSVLLVGVASAVFGLARHAFMTTYVPARMRARALSTLAGAQRFGRFASPFLGAGLIAWTGDVRSALWIQVVTCVLAVVVLIIFPDPAVLVGGAGRGVGASEAAAEGEGFFRILRDRREVLLKLGVASALFQGLRGARDVALPLWAVAIGVDGATTSLVIGIMSAIDFSLFYLGGLIMDRFGRRAAAISTAGGLGVAFFVLAATGLAPDPFVWFVASSVLFALGNGLGSGIIMTLGADLAGRRNPAPFLGAWRFVTDAGWAGGPLLLSALTGAVSLPIASIALGVVGMVSVVLLRVFMPRRPESP